MFKIRAVNIISLVGAALGLVFLCAGSLWADQVYNTSLIVDGNACVGVDCASGEVFAEDTLRLKENNLRIYFDDTSSDAGVPSQDWWLIANEYANGGESFFGISDTTNYIPIKDEFLPVQAELISISPLLFEYTYDQTFDFSSFETQLMPFAELTPNQIGTFCEQVEEGTGNASDANNLLDRYCPDMVAVPVTGNTGLPLETLTLPYAELSDSQVMSYCELVPAGTGNVTVTDPFMGTMDYLCSETVEVEVPRPEWLSFRVDPGYNSLLILDETVEVSTVAAPRRLVNVADGIDAHDVATVSQYNAVTDLLGEVQALGNVPGAEIVDLQGRMDTAETEIDTLGGRMDSVESELQVQAAAIDTNTGEVADINARIGDTDLAELSASLAVTGGDEYVRASATGEGSTAFGSGASARTRDTAIGYQATVTADGSVAVGADSLVESENSVAVGADAHVAVDAAGGVALGQNAEVQQGTAGSVAIGQNAVADEAQTVSVGSADNERRVSHVAAAVNDTDVVNLQQLQTIEATFLGSLDQMGSRLNSLDDRLDRVGALATAFSALVPNARSRGNTQLSLGIGHYSSENAVAAGVFHYLSDTVLLTAGVSSAFASDSCAGQAGVMVGW